MSEYQLQSDEIKDIAQALCKAQANISGARKDSENPFFKSNYADLGSVTEAIRESATANELSYTQANLPSEKGITVVTTVMHSSGQWLRGFLFLPSTKVDPQQFGSAMTYARRYGLAAAFGVVQEDDDGNAASKQSKPKDTDKFKTAIKDCKSTEAVTRTTAAWADTISKWVENDKAEARQAVTTRHAELKDAEPFK